MEMNKKIFLEYFFLPLFGVLSLIWEFKWEGIEWIGRNTHFFLFPYNLKFSFPLKLGGMRGNEIRFNEFFTKTPKIPLYI